MLNLSEDFSNIKYFVGIAAYPILTFPVVDIKKIPYERREDIEVCVRFVSICFRSRKNSHGPFPRIKTNDGQPLRS